MAIVVDSSTRLLVQGITGREGSFHTARNKAYGTNVVAGVTPGKGGENVEGIPVFDTVRQAVAEAQPNTAMVKPPASRAPRCAAESMPRAIPLTTVTWRRARSAPRRLATSRAYGDAARDPTMATEGRQRAPGWPRIQSWAGGS